MTQRCISALLCISISRTITTKLSAQAAEQTISNLNQNYSPAGSAFDPDIETSRSYRSILSAYDDLIENNTRRIAILEEMARRIFEEWFVHFRAPAARACRWSIAPSDPCHRGGR